MSYALSALHNIVLQWSREDQPIDCATAMDAIRAALAAGEPPTATYDAVAQTITCPHCGEQLTLSDWILIETGYERYWSLHPPDEDGNPVLVSDDHFADNGDDASPRLAHDSHDCYRNSLVPPNLRWGY